jgi:hypothetical protein
MCNRQQVKLSGELYVASELSRRGFNVGLTVGNVENIDLLAEKNGNHFSIQVKSVRRRQNNSFQIRNDQIIENCWYIFVNIDSENLGTYECAIMTPVEVRENLRMPSDSRRNGLRVSILNNRNFINRWDRIN